MPGQDILPVWVDVVWIIALAAVLAFHCTHLVRMGGQHRYFHAAHIVMLAGMIHMYASMALSWNGLPGSIWMVIFAGTSAAIVGWMLVRITARKPFSFLWILALVQQAAMIYMWAPTEHWVPAFSYGLAVYLALEMMAWLVELCDDDKPGRGNAVGPGDRRAVMPLGHGSAHGNASMAVMAAAMAYMFAGMELAGTHVMM